YPQNLNAFFDLENTNQELRNELKDLYINSTTQIDVAGNRKVVVIHKFSGKDVIFTTTQEDTETSQEVQLLNVPAK
ncbi:hypothetical protein H5410_030027, partial [Solanum commersonii]